MRFSLTDDISGWRTVRPFFVFEKSMLLNSAPFLANLKIWPTRFFYYAAASGAHLRQNHSIEPVKVLYNIYIYYFFYFIFFFGDVRARSCTFVHVRVRSCTFVVVIGRYRSLSVILSPKYYPMYTEAHGNQRKPTNFSVYGVEIRQVCSYTISQKQRHTRKIRSK